MKKTMGWVVACLALYPATVYANVEEPMDPTLPPSVKPPAVVEPECPEVPEDPEEPEEPGELADPEELECTEDPEEPAEEPGELPDKREPEQEPDPISEPEPVKEPDKAEDEDKDDYTNDPWPNHNNLEPSEPQFVNGKKVPDPKPQKKQKEDPEEIEPIQEMEADPGMIDHPSSVGTGGPLPKTATQYPSMALVGGTLAGVGCVLLRRKK